MNGTVSDFLIQRLLEWGITRIYGYPGDGINGIMGAIGRAENRLEFIQVRHEEMAAFMACGHAKFTGEVGVCLATSGPGAIHLLNGLYDAKLDHQPVVAIVGQQRRAAVGGDYQQEVDLVSLFKDVAHEYVHEVTTAAQMRHLIDRAIRIALAERTVTCVIVPNDVQELDAVETPPREHGTIHSGVAKALLGKAAVPDELPYVTGAIGLLGTKPSWEMMNECDTLLMVGSNFPYSEFLPKEGQARGVQIDIDGRLLSIRYPMEVGLVGDSKETLRALLPLLEHHQDRSFCAGIEKSVAEWWKLLEERAMNAANPINPQRLFWELSPRLPDDCILTSDSGSAANWFARDLQMRRGIMASLSGGLATMGPGVPYAIAAKFAHPDRVAIALVGDGAMQMNGINELITIGKYWQRWSDPRLVVLVLNNRDLNQVTWEQRVMEGDPKFEASQDLPGLEYARFATQLGLRGVRVESPDQIGGAWDEALAADRPFVLDVVTDPEVPPLPPHITFEEAKMFALAVAKGDPGRRAMIERSLKDKLEEFL